MTPECNFSTSTEDIAEIVLQHEIKYRAYEFYERRHTIDETHDLNLGTELPRVAYAAAMVQRHLNGEIEETRAVRAARIYLQALSSLLV
jgi:hypothetical protein